MKQRRILGCLAAFVMTLHASAQVPDWNTGGNNITTGEWFGADGSSTIPLRIRHDANQPIEWYTDAIHRMQLYQTRTGVLPIFSGGTVNVPQNGYLGLSGTPGFFATNGYGPISRLHLADEDPGNEGQNHYNQPWGYRNWMKNGITFTGNHDQAYIGQRYYTHDSTDLVIHWSDNADKSAFGPDHCRFLFTSDPRTGSTRGARSQEGLELMRLLALDSLEGVVGIGDFAQPGLAEPEPTERLDILDRTIRLRRLIPDYNNDTIGRVVVVDVNGRLHWRRITTWPSTGGADCDWTIQNDGSSGSGVSHNLITAVGTDDDCPDDADFVGIGTTSPWGKLHVRWTGPSQVSDAFGLVSHLDGASYGKRAGHFEASGEGEVHIGVDARASGAVSEGGYNGNQGVNAIALANADGYTKWNRGVRSQAQVAVSNEVDFNIAIDALTVVPSTADVDFNAAIYGIAYNSGTSTSNYGGYFEGWSPNTATGYGVFATSAGASTNWAGYFAGDVQAGGTYLPSDANLKSGISAVSQNEVQNVLNGLTIHQYEYNTTQFPQMHLPGGVQVGLLA